MKRAKILFVDDEVNILNALKRKLHFMNTEWDMSFADSGKKGLELMELSPFDILVTDMRMPEMSGIELLSIVYEKYPDVVRIILSGHTDRNAVMQSIGLAHQFFSKPTETDDLVETLQRIIYVKNQLNNVDMLKVISQMKSLPILPSIYKELMEIIKSEDVSLKKIGDLIAQDISISAKILQLVNSSFFSVMKKVSDIHQAINLLGLEIVKDIILTFHIFNQVDISLIKRFHLKELWIHSLGVGTLAKSIAQDLNLPIEKSESAFVAGLLHDIGRLILVLEFPSTYAEVIQRVKKEKISLIEAERSVFHISHCEIAAYLTSLWGFSSCITESILLHHQPNVIPHKSVTIGTSLYLGNYIFHKLTSPNLLSNFVNIIEDNLDQAYINRYSLQKLIDEYLERYKDSSLPLFQIY